MKNNKYKYLRLIKNREIEPKCDKASISKIYKEKNEIEKIKEINILSYNLIFLNIDKNDTRAMKFKKTKKILKE